jgi:hypothetical protein
MAERRRSERTEDMRIISFWRRRAHFRRPVVTSPDEFGTGIAADVVRRDKPMRDGRRRLE